MKQVPSDLGPSQVSDQVGGTEKKSCKQIDGFLRSWGGNWGGRSPPIGGEIHLFPPNEMETFPPQACGEPKMLTILRHPANLGGNW